MSLFLCPLLFAIPFTLARRNVSFSGTCSFSASLSPRLPRPLYCALSLSDFNRPSHLSYAHLMSLQMTLFFVGEGEGGRVVGTSLLMQRMRAKYICETHAKHFLPIFFQPLILRRVSRILFPISVLSPCRLRFILFISQLAF